MGEKMSAFKILQFGDKNLRQKTKNVTLFNKKLHETIDRIAITLESADNGAALAANQVGINKSIIVIKYLDEYFEFINPKIIASTGEQYEYEGCLSLPHFSGKVKRAKTVTVQYQNRNGEEQQVERSDRMAICFQHEIDHLSGILFIDKMGSEYVINDENNVRVKVSELIRLTSRF